MREWRRGWLSVLLVIASVVSGCGWARTQVTLAPLSAVQPAVAPFRAVEFPRDEAPHDMLTEWWYYTGHLEADGGRRYGFELVVFQTIRGDYPVVYLGQFAITDRGRDSFQHDSRVSQGSQVGGTDGFDLAVQDWRIRGALGRDTIEAGMADYSLTAELRAEKRPVLHDDDGLVSFDIAGDSYYYSYSRMTLSGTLTDHGETFSVRGQAWFDHQWGNFLVMGGGWDWFSIQLDDGTDLMLNHLRDDAGQLVGVWGTYVEPNGDYRALHESDFSIRPTGSWVSPLSGGTYPMGWHVQVPESSLELRLAPVRVDQELVSTGAGPTYWEGAVDIAGTRSGKDIGGLGYVELTGYVRR